MKLDRKGGISAVIATIIGVVVLTAFFYQFFFMHLDLERYNMMNQYARDVLLICETKDKIEKDYLLQAKEKLAERIVKKDEEYVKMYIAVNGEQYDVDVMPQHIQTDFGNDIELLIEYYYQPQRLSFNNGFVPERAEDKMEKMGVRLFTISKNRGTSDG